MKLNPLKCAFGVSSDKFLGLMANTHGTKVKLEQIEALKTVRSPSTRKEMQSLNEKVAALSRFILKTTDKCIYFFNALKQEKSKFMWMSECEPAFLELLDHLKSSPFLSKPP